MKPRVRKYARRMAKVVLWAALVSLVALFLSYYLDTPVPEGIPETWKVKVMDASMRTYGHLMKTLVKMGVTTYFSPLDRKLSDWFILTQMTGYPWGMSTSRDQSLKVNDTVLDGVRVIIYEPIASIRSDDRPALIFMHGGGWSLLSVDSYDPLIQKIAKESGVVIFSINYRQSPEYPYPTPLDDCITVVNYVTDNYFSMRIDPYRVAVGGDSAGGNMAASIALRLRDKIAMQFLIVPVLQAINFRTTSFRENTYYFADSINSPTKVVFMTNYLGISPEHMFDFLVNNHTSQTLKRSHYAAKINQSVWMIEDYVRDPVLKREMHLEEDFGNTFLSNQIEEQITDPYFAPLMANDTMLRNLPEAYVVTCGYDLIRDDGVMYSQRLKTAGTKVTHRHFEDGFHHAWFFPHGPLKIDVAVRMVNDIVIALKTRL